MTASERVRAALGSWGAATLAWAGFLAGHVVIMAGAAPLDAGVAARLVLVAAALSVVVGLPLLLLHGVEARRPGVHTGLAVVLVLAAWPAWAQASFLTAGDRIAQHALVDVIRAVLLAGAWAGLAGLWLWHRAVLAPGRWRWPAVAAGALGAALAFLALAGRLDAYAYFARFVVVVAWVLVATLVAAPLVGRRRAQTVAFALALAATLAALALVATRGLSAARARTAGRAPALEWSDVLPSRAPLSLALDLAPAQPGECAARLAAEVAPAPLADKARRRHIVFVSVDALRTDALADMPALSAFLAGSLVFTDAHTTYPATVFAMGGAFTGWSPHQLLLAPETPASVFGRAGWQLLAHLYLPGGKWFALPAIDDLLIQGAPTTRYREATSQTDAVLADLRRFREGKDRHFVWVHYFEPHQPWITHPGFPAGAGARERYRSEVAYLDGQLGRLFAGLREGGWLDDSLVVFFADHGEALGERSYQGHHVYLNGWLTDVPLAVHAPGLPAGQRDDVVELTDVAATAAHFLDLPPPPAGTGRSLLAPAAGARISVAEAFPVRGEDLFREAGKRVATLAELRSRAAAVARARAYEPKSALTSEGWRFIVHRGSGVEELYDRAADPGETVNLAARRPELTAALRAQLAAWYRARGRDAVCALSGK